jgi:hypothetical protein
MTLLGCSRGRRPMRQRSPMRCSRKRTWRSRATCTCTDRFVGGLPRRSGRRRSSGKVAFQCQDSVTRGYESGVRRATLGGMYRVVGAVAFVVCALTSCSGNQPREPAAEPAHHVAAAEANVSVRPLVVRHSSAHPGVARQLREGAAIVLSPTSVEFAMGGSGSCPPVARSVSRTRGTLVVPITPKHPGCTLDLVDYTVVVTLNQPLLSDTAIVRLRTGYGPAKDRIPLVRA